MTDDLRAQSSRDRPAPPPASDLSTADLAAAAERSAGASTTDLKRNVADREVERARAGSTPADASAPRDTPLLAAEVVGQLRSQWTDIQAGFVDEPRRA